MQVLLRHRIVAFALGGAALAWIAAQAWLRQDAGAVDARPARQAAALQAPGPAPAHAPDAITPTLAPTIPPGVTGAQWQALRDELRAQPGGDAELRRIADYLAWSDLLRRFRAAQGDAAERLRLARALDAGLPARLRAGEVSAAEARQIEIALLDVMLDDPAERAPALQRWIAANTTPASTDPRQAEFERRQAAIVAVHPAQPPGTRDAAALERDLEALRREVFQAGAPAAR